MILDVTGTVLIPGNQGRDCPGNGEFETDCCCDACDYMQCCLPTHDHNCCKACNDPDCPHTSKNA